MRKLTWAFGLVLGIGLLLPPAASAQSGRRESDRVCVYQDNFFSGDYRCFYAGEEISDLGNWRNKISSIRIYGEARLSIFANKQFEGASREVTADLRDLAQVPMVLGAPSTISWNDSIESLYVTSRYVSRDRRDDGRDDRRDDRGDNRRGPPNSRNDVVCVYEHANYAGRSECFSAGEQVADLGRSGRWSDQISSIRIYGSSRITVYRDINFRGDRVTLAGNIPDLSRLRLRGSISWNDQISSFEVSNGRGLAYGRDSRFGR